jgi:tetratricopeptide (TPR) repeat protein
MTVGEAIIKAKKLFEEKKFRDSLALFKKILPHAPTDPGIHSYIGNLFRELGDFPASIIHLKKAYELKRNISTAINLSNALKSSDQLVEAENLLLAHIKDRSPQLHILLNNLSIIKKDQGDFTKACEYLELALHNEPNSSAALINLANLLKSEQLNSDANLQRAEKLYKKSIIIDPSNYSSYVNLFEFLYKTNRTDDIPQIIKNAPKVMQDLDIFKLYMGCSLNGQKKFNEAQNLLSSFSLSSGHDHQIHKFEPIRLYFLARSNEGLNAFEKAYNNFETSNKLTFKDPKYRKIKKEPFLDLVQARLSFFSNLDSKKFLESDIYDDGTERFFITGFPRSGTTLVDTILRSHSKIHSMEEKGSMKRTILNFSKSMNNIAYLDCLDKYDFSQIQKFYDIDIQKYHDKSKKIQIDRHPFHCIYAGEIRKFFPSSKFIFITRNPLDVIFSCFTQNFKPQISTANFQTIKESKYLYIQCMKLWFAASDALNIDCHYIKYEDIIDDFDISIGATLKYLKCDWDNSIRKYYETARKRKIINTASHSQVTKPLYGSSIEKWKNYIKYFDLEDSEDDIKNISERFGYKF